MIPRRNSSKAASSVSQKKYLERWLRLRQRDLATAGSVDAGEPFAPTEGACAATAPITTIRHLVRPFDDTIVAGDIRLLTYREVATDHSLPRYIAVLQAWDEGLFLIAPYSKYHIPATTGELATQRGHFSLETLQLWNARTIHELALKTTWRVDQMAPSERQDAMAAFRHVLTGEPLPKSLTGRIGAPILSPEDPRIAYQDEEAAVFCPLQARSMLIQELCQCLVCRAGDDSTDPVVRFAEVPLPMAADDGSPYSVLLRGDARLLAQISQGPATAIPAEMRYYASSRRLLKDGDRVVGHWLLPDDFPTDIAGVALLVHRMSGAMLCDATMVYDGDGRLLRFSAPARDELLELTPQDISIIVF